MKKSVFAFAVIVASIFGTQAAMASQQSAQVLYNCFNRIQTTGGPMIAIMADENDAQFVRVISHGQSALYLLHVVKSDANEVTLSANGFTVKVPQSGRNAEVLVQSLNVTYQCQMLE